MGAVRVLLLLGLVAKFWWLILPVLGGAVLFAAVLCLAFHLVGRLDARYEARAALVAWADRQHAWVLAGDERGVYGDYAPAPFTCSRTTDIGSAEWQSPPSY